MTKNITRSFVVGDEWIYYKIYTGIITADSILINHLKPILENLVKDNNVDQWFFIRYYDPDFHLRLRLHFSGKNNFENIINRINLELKKLKEIDLIWKIQIDSYDRELERYGAFIIEQSELIFYHDSIMILNALSILEDGVNLNLQWLWGLFAINAFMDDFNLSLNEKKNLVENLQIVFGKEFGINKNMRKQLSLKYHKFKTEIDAILSKKTNNNDLFTLIEEKSASIKPAIEKIKEQLTSSIEINHLISSHIHMTMNRLFQSKNRLNEFVSYQMLLFYYESKIARIKYSK
ncbi:thiopeptide-type bacteriocin biosynthesis protein [Flavobacterium sp. JAS]|uniref:thiopeptide-type bacteriocin biosynthesis protein n=1 Tax=Flavobacterium sp. JAS TaxID=2897329 RepID=UPI001E3D9EB7|nr:thiopeptide-type bacteriocin biosynthesis protein [Flavobacterium sp. JAS]MCD0472671.1 thiopeptide-type bacteriocin biosynthesis protein [Flavobacterium sp. JAS]